MRLRSALIAYCLIMAALTAPPSALAIEGAAATGTGTTPTTATGTGTTPVPVPAAPAVPPLPADRRVRIGLGRSQTSAEVTAAGGLYVVGEGAVQWQSPPGQVVKLTLVGDKVQVEGLTKQLTGPVRLVPAGPGIGSSVAYGGRTYRGEVEVLIPTKTRKLSVINVVPIEEYLQGVVPKEMSYNWPIETLKAQSVAARTYAMANLGRFSDEGFDMVGTVDSQVYGGIAQERTQTNSAIAATKGQVLTYNGQLTTTYYFSSSGGHTENSEIIWTAMVPYLRGVADFDNLPGNLLYAWRYPFTLADFARKLKESGRDVGEVRSVTPGNPIGPSGRPARWSVVGSTQTTTLTAEQMRWTLGLPSSPKALVVKVTGAANLPRSYTATEQIHVVGGDGVVRSRTNQGTILMGATGIMSQGPVVAVGPKVEQAGGIEAVGGGYGHTVGMSQWGAHGLALLGRNYQQILTHYYIGTKVESR